MRRAVIGSLAVAAAFVGGLIAFLGPHGASPVASRGPEAHAEESVRSATPLARGDEPAELRAVDREPASSPILDQFDEQHREAVSHVLGEPRTVVVTCLVLRVDRIGRRSRTGMVRLLSRETSEATGLKKGDVIEAYHTPDSFSTVCRTAPRDLAGLAAAPGSLALHDRLGG
ncbi:MAG: hypothetical protein WAT39_02180 [Planctomycetota bacterium]